jgi:hypothetical protein
MPNPDENDIIIAIGQAIRNAMGSSNNDFSLQFSAVEENWELPQGSVAKYLEEAAKDTGVDILRKGSNSALLQKKRGGGGPVVVQRA